MMTDDGERDALAYLITAHRFRERGLAGAIGEPDIAVARPLADFLMGEGFHRSVVPEPSAEGWSTEDRRSAEAEAKRRFMEWIGSEDAGVERFGTGSVNGFILGAEWWKATHPSHSEAHGEPSDAQVKAAIDEYLRCEGAGKIRAMRAALRAALAVTEQGENREGQDHG